MAGDPQGGRGRRTTRTLQPSMFGRLFAQSRRRRRETQERESREARGFGTPQPGRRQAPGGERHFGPEPWRNPSWYAERTDHPHGLGDYDTRGPPPMERGWHLPRIDDRHEVDRMGIGGFGGGYRGPAGPSTGRWGEYEPTPGREARPGPEEAGGWYGGGVHEAAPRWRGQDFGNLGGPHMGRFGYEPPSGTWEGRGAGGPLGSSREREAGERGRLYGSRMRGRVGYGPIRGEAVAGRGHVGSEDYRDLTRWGEGGDPRTHERYLERREEPDHFPQGEPWR